MKHPSSKYSVTAQESGHQDDTNTMPTWRHITTPEQDKHLWSIVDHRIIDIYKQYNNEWS